MIEYNNFKESEITFKQNITFEEKVYLMKLLGNYKKIINFNSDLNEIFKLEDDLYKKYNIKNDKEKIIFELKRIKDNFSKKAKINDSILKDYAYLNTTFKFYNDTNNLMNSSVLKDIFECIIILELKLGMKIPLYKEIVELFNEYCQKEKYIIKNKKRKLALSDEFRNESDF